MAVVLPSGWTEFEGGADPVQCDSETPPTITVTPPTGFDCDDLQPIYEVALAVAGGVAPFDWEVSAGLLTPSGPGLRLATLVIDQAADLVFPSIPLDPHGCGIGAFVKRGLEIFPTSTGDPNDVNCRTQISCSQVTYNCYGVPIRFTCDAPGGCQATSLGDDACAAQFNPEFGEGHNPGFESQENCDVLAPALCVPSASYLALPNGPDACNLAECTPLPADPITWPGNHEDCDPSISDGDGISSTGASHLLMTDNGEVCDIRTEASIAVGCSPCEVLDEIVVTVTDALNNLSVIIVNINGN